MNSSTLSRVMVILLGVAFAIYIIIESITSNTSILGRLYLFVAIGAFLMGVLTPRLAIYALIFCTGYIDLFKRLMVIAGQPTNFDVACTLATPPLLCAGAVISLILSIIIGKVTVTSSIVWSFISACAVLLLAILTFSAQGARGIGNMINFAAYPFLLVIIPVYFSAIEQKEKLMRIAYIVFIGVALYMIKHALYGLADFEYDYLLTYLSQEVRILWEGENSRYFSTMNGAGIVSIMCALMFFWSFANVWKKSFAMVVMRYGIAVIFAIACYYTLSRTGWVCGIVASITYLLFLRWSTTLSAYVLGISFIIMLVVFSPQIKDAKVLERTEIILQATFATSDSRSQQATSLGSFNGRLNGWVNIRTKSYVWTPFGWKLAGREFKDYDLVDLGDDIIFWFLVKYGYIPVFFGSVTFLTFMYKLHRFVCQLPVDSKERKISNICLATSIGIMSGGLGNSAQLSVFPVNIYFYLCLSFVFSIYLQHRERAKNVIPQITPLMPTSLAMLKP